MATTKDKQKIRNAKEVKEEQKEIKTTKCKRGKKICVQCAEKGLGKCYSLVRVYL